MPKGFKHGSRYTPEYHTWLNIKSRCSNHKNKSYKYYGGRGIKVCESWEKDFVNFYNDMGPRPSKNHQIDRKNNNEDYNGENCFWVERIINMRNRSDSKYWFIDGVKYESLSHAAEKLNVTINTIKRWCDGRKDGKYKYPPKNNCWSERKYK